MKIYIVNGAPGSGKTTFEQMVQDLMGSNRCFILSTIDRVKEIAKECGWDGTKTPENRKFLSDLKDLLTQWNDYPSKYIIDTVHSIQNYVSSWDFSDTDKFIIFIDCREPKEIEKLKQALNAQTLLVRRPQLQSKPSNHADANVEDYVYDIIVSNAGTIDDLSHFAKDFINL